ncbi:MAG: hypothetical protein PHI19_03530 [Clostridia bacterium]|nr:hypothetical protein [Clostridia bacterium]
MKKILKLAVAITMLIAMVALSAVALTACDKQPEYNYLEQDTTFTITEFTLGALLGDSLNLAESLLDPSQSYIKLNQDGTCQVKIAFTEELISFVNFMAGDMAMGNEEIESFSYQYLEVLFPGFDLTDVSGSLALIENSLGLRIAGLDDGNPEYENLKQQIESGNGITELSLPEGLALELNSVYSVKELHSEYSGDYTAVYIGGYDSSYNQEPYLIFTMYTNEDNQSCLKARFEILGGDVDSIAY